MDDRLKEEKLAQIETFFVRYGAVPMAGVMVVLFQRPPPLYI